MFLDDDRKHHEILEKVHKYDINKRREVIFIKLSVDI